MISIQFLDSWPIAFFSLTSKGVLSLCGFLFPAQHRWAERVRSWPKSDTLKVTGTTSVYVHVCTSQGLEQHRCLDELSFGLLINSLTHTFRNTHSSSYTPCSPVSILVLPRGQSSPPANRTAVLSFTGSESWHPPEMSSWISEHGLRPRINTSSPKHWVRA